MGRAMWSAEHSISSGDSPRNSGLIYGNFSGSSEPGLPLPPELPPAMIPPMNPATADLTRVSMLVVRRGGASVGRCAAPRLPFPGFPPSSAALLDDGLGGQQEPEETVYVSFIQSAHGGHCRREDDENAHAPRDHQRATESATSALSPWEKLTPAYF